MPTNAWCWLRFANSQRIIGDPVWKKRKLRREPQKKLKKSSVDNRKINFEQVLGVVQCSETSICMARKHVTMNLWRGRLNDFVNLGL